MRDEDFLRPSPVKRYLRPNQAAQFLTEDVGLQTAVKTLAKLRCVGGGPSYQKYGSLVVYGPEDLLSWAQKRLSQKVTSTSMALSKEPS
jgi:hypothetical protein